MNKMDTSIVWQIGVVVRDNIVTLNMFPFASISIIPSYLSTLSLTFCNPQPCQSLSALLVEI